MTAYGGGGEGGERLVHGKSWHESCVAWFKLADMLCVLGSNLLCRFDTCLAAVRRRDCGIWRGQAGPCAGRGLPQVNKVTEPDWMAAI